MNKVVKILMERNGMTETEALTLLTHTRNEIDVALADNDYSLVEDIIYCDLGLEMDYIAEILLL